MEKIKFINIKKAIVRWPQKVGPKKQLWGGQFSSQFKTPLLFRISQYYHLFPQKP